MSNYSEVPAANSLQQWLAQGEQLYAAAVNEFHAMEAELEKLEAGLAAKREEVNQIAQVIGKPPVHSAGRATAQIIPAPEVMTETDRPASSGANATIARALTGKFGR